MPMAKSADATVCKIVRAVDNVPADDVALVKKYLSAEEAHDPRPWMDGDQWLAMGVLHHRTIAMLQVDDREVPIGAHGIASRIHHGFVQFRTGKLVHSGDTAGERKITHQHVDPIVKIAVNVVDEILMFDRDRGARFSGVRAQPGGLALYSEGLAPEADVFALAITVEAFLPGDVLWLAI